MKTQIMFVALSTWVLGTASAQQQPVSAGSNAPPSQTIASSAAPAPASPPSAAPKLGMSELQDLVAGIALYPDPLLAILLPASAYPLEIVQAVRFIRDTNNLPLLDQQPWDTNVKNLARFPEVMEKMNEDLAWTIQLGQAFADQPMEIMDAIQALRGKAHDAGSLTTTPQQIVIVTNAVVERIYEQQVVYVTNTIIEVQPANPQIIYVPQYNPVVVYVRPVYVSPMPVVTFGVGVTVGVTIVNRCNWHYGGVWVGRGGMVVWGGGRYPYYPPPPGFRPPHYYPPPGYRPPPPGYRPPGYPPPGYHRPAAGPGSPSGGRPSSPGTPSTLPATGQRWQPDQSRRRGTSSVSNPIANTRESRGWNSSSSAPTTRPSTGVVQDQNRPSTGVVPSRPNTGTVPSGNRPSAGTSPSQPISGGQAGNRPGTPTTGQSIPQRSSGQTFNQPSRAGYTGSPLSGVGNSTATRDFSSRGAASRNAADGAKGGRRQ